MKSFIVEAINEHRDQGVVQAEEKMEAENNKQKVSMTQVVSQMHQQVMTMGNISLIPGANSLAKTMGQGIMTGKGMIDRQMEEAQKEAMLMNRARGQEMEMGG